MWHYEMAVMSDGSRKILKVLEAILTLVAHLQLRRHRLLSA